MKQLNTNYIYNLIIKVTIIFCMVIFQSSCIYRPKVQQGNVVTQAKIDKLKVGMTKEQVKKIMHTPTLTPVINLNCWHYYYSLASNYGKINNSKDLALYFVDDKLSSYSGDWVPANLPKNKL